MDGNIPDQDGNDGKMALRFGKSRYIDLKAKDSDGQIDYEDTYIAYQNVRPSTEDTEDIVCQIEDGYEKIVSNFSL